ELGLTDTVAEVQALTDQRAKLVQSLAQIERRTQTLQNERLQVDDPRGPYYHEAIAKFREMLANADPRALAEQAKLTATTQDDAIVDRLQGLHTEMEHVTGEVRQRQQTAAQLTHHLQSVGTIIN